MQAALFPSLAAAWTTPPRRAQKGVESMAFPWPGQKKDAPVGARPEFPAALEAELPEALPAKADNPLKSATREPIARPKNGSESDPLPALTERLETLGRMLDEAKERVTSYLLHRESQAGTEDDARELGRKIEALAEKLEQGSGQALEHKLNALCDKIGQLAGADSRGAAATAAGGDSKSAIDALKDALVPAITKLRDTQTEQHNTQSTAIRQLAELVPQYFNALPQYFTAVQQQVVAAQQHADAGLRAIIDILRPPQTEAEPAVGGDWQEALLGGELAHNPALSADRTACSAACLAATRGRAAWSAACCSSARPRLTRCRPC